MALIKSISGIRGTIGGVPGTGLSPLDIVKFTAAYATFIAANTTRSNRTVVVGRDARLSGKMVNDIVVGTLTAMGFDVINIGQASTPTTEIAVVAEKACGGIILTASHNPKQWNALKLLNENGEFLNDAQGKEVLRIAEEEAYSFAEVDELGHEYTNNTYNLRHIEQVLALDLVDVEAIRKANLTVAVDAVNSVGGVVIPQLLRALGVKNIIELNCEPNGKFAHTPEPIPQNLTEISGLMAKGVADVGFVVDPDVDRLAIVMENGEMFVEEYTLVSIADYVLSHTPGSTVSNLSSSRALRDVTRRHGCEYSAAAVGEVNVTTKMKETGAIIGGEGNGGVIYPALHVQNVNLHTLVQCLLNQGEDQVCLAGAGRATNEHMGHFGQVHIHRTVQGNAQGENRGPLGELVLSHGHAGRELHISGGGMENNVLFVYPFLQACNTEV